MQLTTKTTIKYIFKESILVTITDYISFGVLFFITIFINKFYGTEHVGIFSLIYAISQITVMSLGSAFSNILRRDVSIDPSLSLTYINNILKIRGAVLLLSLLIVMSSNYFFSDHSPLFTYFLFLMLLTKGVDLANETFYSAYQSLGTIKQFAIIKSCNFISLGVIALPLCYFKLPLHFLYETHLAIATLFFLFNALYYSKKFESIRAQILSNSNFLVYLLKETWPIIINAVFFQVSSRISILIIEAINGTKLQGTYSLAVTIITGLTAFSNSISIVLFPYFSRTYKNEPSGFFTKLNKVLLAFIGCSVLLFILFHLCEPIILYYIGHLPEEGPKVFNIMSLSIIPLFLIPVMGYGFIIIRKQYDGMLIAGIILVLNIISFFIFSKYYGIVGSAMAFVITQTVSFSLMYIWLYKLMKVDKPREM
jgi:O-antigen/teichoic acid export membrane protein